MREGAACLQRAALPPPGRPAARAAARRPAASIPLGCRWREDVAGRRGWREPAAAGMPAALAAAAAWSGAGRPAGRRRRRRWATGPPHLLAGGATRRLQASSGAVGRAGLQGAGQPMHAHPPTACQQQASRSAPANRLCWVAGRTPSPLPPGSDAGRAAVKGRELRGRKEGGRAGCTAASVGRQLGRLAGYGPGCTAPSEEREQEDGQNYRGTRRTWRPRAPPGRCPLPGAGRVNQTRRGRSRAAAAWAGAPQSRQPSAFLFGASLLCPAAAGGGKGRFSLRIEAPCCRRATAAGGDHRPAVAGPLPRPGLGGPWTACRALYVSQRFASAQEGREREAEGGAKPQVGTRGQCCRSTRRCARNEDARKRCNWLCEMRQGPSCPCPCCGGPALLPHAVIYPPAASGKTLSIPDRRPDRRNSRSGSQAAGEARGFLRRPAALQRVAYKARVSSL